MARVRRFAALRAAQRALVPCVRSNDVFPPVEPIRGARSQLKEMVALLKQGRTEELANLSLGGVDGVLDGYALALREVADSVPLPQFRAMLTEWAQDRRDELVGLLDLVLEDVPGILERLHLIDFLITLLATAKEGDTWSIVIEPTNVSEGTRVLSLNAPMCDPQLLARIESRFQQAREGLTAGAGFKDARNDIGVFKRKIADYLFVPEIMRCVVAYNLAVRMWHEQRIDAARHEDDLEEGMDPALANAQSHEASPPAEGASLEPPTLDALEAAVAARITDTAAPSSSAGMIAAGVDLGPLGRTYRQLFSERNPDATESLRRQIIALGLVYQSLPGIEPTLVQCGLTPEMMEEEWLREISEGVRNRTNELIASNEYDHARSLSDLQSRFLVAATLDARRKRDLETPVEKATTAAEPAPAGPAPMHDVSGALARARKKDRSAARSRPVKLPDVDDAPTSNKRVLVMAVSLVLLVAASIFNVISANTVKGVYSANDLYALSPLLKSGYRPEDEKANLFMGTMGPEWDELGQPQRKMVALRLLEKLAPDGITEVMLYDQRRTLQVHYVDGHNEYPGWDDDPAPSRPQARSSGATGGRGS